MKTLRVALAQINTTVGDLDGNAAKVIDYANRAREASADLVAFPELTVPGYPPEDLLLRRSFILDNQAALRRIAASVRGITAVAGFVDSNADIHNAAAVIHEGEIAGVYHKQFLPNYGVFDEKRYFRAGERSQLFTIAGARVGVNICEDIWYPEGPTQDQALAGADVIININGSPFHKGKRADRERMVATRAADNAVILCYVNLVGGQDELVFDGSSTVFDQTGELIARAPAFEESLLVVDLNLDSLYLSRLHNPLRRLETLRHRAAPVDEVFVSGEAGIRAYGHTGKSPAGSQTTNSEALETRTAHPEALEERAASGLIPSLVPAEIAPPLSEEAEVYQALVTGTRDYVHKNGFETVLVGVSGGIDSSIVATIATDALGPGHVVGVSNPSRYSSEGSIADARALAENLGIKLLIIPIEPGHAAYLEMLEPVFAGTAPGTAEENIQSRIRGNIWMALSNKFGWQPVLSCGNKSEMATGYATLYGDMAGGFAVIKDVPKTLVYRLARYRNALAGRDLIPRAIIDKPPSAELKPDQLDTDSLPSYDVLDPILEAYVEQDRGLDEIVAMGFEEATVRRIVSLVDRNEYKRRQAPPGVKITPRAFGRDRRLPITNKYRP
ncbi:MAG: NAD+ synthase [Dehalococcoidia bacterium]|nr:NAD+ synthase [Dehalococcoidia bacterium]